MVPYRVCCSVLETLFFGVLGYMWGYVWLLNLVKQPYGTEAEGVAGQFFRMILKKKKKNKNSIKKKQIPAQLSMAPSHN